MELRGLKVHLNKMSCLITSANPAFNYPFVVKSGIINRRGPHFISYVATLQTVFSHPEQVEVIVFINQPELGGTCSSI